jgi:hypothetical protein
MPLADYHIIRTYLPESWDDEEESYLPRVLKLLRASDPVGRIGNYAAVYEIVLGNKGFTPLEGAKPPKGTIDTPARVLSHAFTTYVSATIPEETVEKFIEDLAALHPWEHPVIAVEPVKLWVP